MPVLETLAKVCALCNESKVVMNEVRTLVIKSNYVLLA